MQRKGGKGGTSKTINSEAVRGLGRRTIVAKTASLAPDGASSVSDNEPRITWIRGDERPGPRQTIGVLELRDDGTSRAVFAERTQVDGRCHVLLARRAWGGKDALATRWWSLVLDEHYKVYTIRNGSCGDSITTSDVPRIIHALEELDLLSEGTLIAMDDGPAVIPRLAALRRGLDSSSTLFHPFRRELMLSASVSPMENC